MGFGIRTSSAKAVLQSTRDLLSDGALYANDKYVRDSPIKYYVLTTGFWQYWDMFSPNPASVDLWCDAQVEFKDGTVKRYQYPRVYLLSIPEKYLKERYRKFFERAHMDDNAYMRPYFAQRIAYLHYKDPKNPPVRVKLFRHSLPIAPPGEKQQAEYTTTEYFNWQVDQQALVEGRSIQ
jgi:hypothetical protein